MDRNIILNIDITSVTGPFLNSILQKPAWQEEDLYPFVDQYIDLANGKESGLRTLVFNTFCQLSSVDSKYMTSFSTFVEKKLAAGAAFEEISLYESPFYSISSVRILTVSFVNFMIISVLSFLHVNIIHKKRLCKPIRRGATKQSNKGPFFYAPFPSGKVSSARMHLTAR